MAKHFSLLAGLLLFSILSLVSGAWKDGGDKSPPHSPFFMSFYDALRHEKIFDRLFNVSFKPKDVGPQYYHAIRKFMMLLGVKNPRVLPAKVAAAAKKVFPTITPFKYFKAFSDSKEATFRNIGALKKYGPDQLAKSFALTLKKAVISIGSYGPIAGLQGLGEGSTEFFKLLKVTPRQTKRHVEGFAADLSKAY